MTAKASKAPKAPKTPKVPVEPVVAPVQAPIPVSNVNTVQPSTQPAVPSEQPIPAKEAEFIPRVDNPGEHQEAVATREEITEPVKEDKPKKAKETDKDEIPESVKHAIVNPNGVGNEWPRG